MRLLDVVTAPWAIEPAKLHEIKAIYATHLRGEKIDIAAVERSIGRPLANEAKRYEVVDGVAVLPIEGVIAKRANLFTQISGGTSSQLVERDLNEAMADSAVHSVILAIDSPGGTVDGTQALADAVFASRGKKPIVTLASGTMASAAYWIGSAASAVYIADGTTQVGSIGVVATHTDISAADASEGKKTTEVVAGTFKRIASPYGPLSSDGRAYMQNQVDYFYSLFVGSVAQQRGASVGKVLSEMADGRIFIGQQAIDAGLVDGVSTLPALIGQLNLAKENGETLTRRVARATKEVQMNEQELMAKGAALERERIKAVLAQGMPGHEALVHGLAFDGKSTAGDAAMAVLAAERGARKSAGESLAADAPKPLALAPSNAIPTQPKAAPSDQQKIAEAHAFASANGVDFVQAMVSLGYAS